MEAKVGERYLLWRDFLQDLTSRGLHGVRLVISNAHEGLKRAITEVFPGVKLTAVPCAFHALHLGPRLEALPRSGFTFLDHPTAKLKWHTINPIL